MTQAVVATTVTGLQGRGIVTTAPNPSQALTWNGSAWAPAGPFLPVAGGTMGGPIVLSGNAAVALNPVSLQQLQAGYLPLTGGSISGSLTVNGLITPSDSGIKGVTDGSVAPAGSVGEILAASQNNIAIAAATWTSFAAISVTPGDWLMFGYCSLVPTTTSATYIACGVSSAINAAPSTGLTSLLSGSSMGTINLPLPPIIVNIAASQLWYVNAYTNFTSGTCSATCSNFAVRFR